MVGPDDYSPWAQGGVVSGVGALIGLILWLRKRVSADNTAIATDKGEINRLRQIAVVDASIVEERDKALKSEEEAWKAYNTLVQEVGELRASKTFLTAEKIRLELRVARLERRLGISFETDIGGT